VTGTSDPKKPVRKSGVGPMFWIIGLGALIAGIILGWYARDFFAVNACLDAGGSWTNPGVCIGALAPLR
jgi:hypothetical protein